MIIPAIEPCKCECSSDDHGMDEKNPESTACRNCDCTAYTPDPEAAEFYERKFGNIFEKVVDRLIEVSKKVTQIDVENSNIPK